MNIISEARDKKTRGKVYTVIIKNTNGGPIIKIKLPLSINIPRMVTIILYISEFE